MFPWEPDPERPGGLRCKPHKQRFVPPHACPGCDTDPGNPLDGEVDAPLAEPPRGCATTEQHERDLTAIAKFAEKASRDLKKTGRSSKTQNAAVKWMEIAVKARRIAYEQAARREDEEIVRRREKRQRARERGAAN